MQMGVLLLIMTAQPDGGYRPIGVFVSVYRLWARARRGHARRCEVANGWGPFAAGSFASSVDAVWRQCVGASK
eukprot:427609-Pyramimonas_sp.AAC.1